MRYPKLNSGPFDELAGDLEPAHGQEAFGDKARFMAKFSTRLTVLAYSAILLDSLLGLVASLALTAWLQPHPKQIGFFVYLVLCGLAIHPLIDAIRTRMVRSMYYKWLSNSDAK
jgi:hypothetical protein